MKWNVCPKSGDCQLPQYEETSGVLVALQQMKVIQIISCLIGSGMVRTHMVEIYKRICINYCDAVIKCHDRGKL